MFDNGPGERGSIPSRVILKTQKCVLNASLLSTQHCKVRIKDKSSNPGKGVTSSVTPRCSSLLKKELSGHRRLRSANLLIYIHGWLLSVLVIEYKIINERAPTHTNICTHQHTHVLYIVYLYTSIYAYKHMCIKISRNTHIHCRSLKFSIYIYIYIYYIYILMIRLGEI